MIRPTISSGVFPYRGPKNRLDISNLLTSSKRDFNFCSDYVGFLMTRSSKILKFYTSGETDKEIQEKLVSYDSDTVDANIDIMNKKVIILKNKINNLLFGG